MPSLVTLDERGRAPLKQYSGAPGQDYIVDVLPDGGILLTPAVVMTRAEAAMWRDRPPVAAFLASDESEAVEVDLDAS